MDKKIIINADDFGLTASVNQAIIDVYRMGNLNSTTFMVNMPGTEDAVVKAKENPGLSIGLHFCITEGTPLTSGTSFVDSKGQFITRSELISKSYKGKINADELVAEFKAQYQKAISFGLELTHTDSHQHILQIPFIFNSLKATFEELALPVRCVHSPFTKLSLNPKVLPRSIKNIIMNRSAKNMREGFSQPMNDYLISIHDKFSDTSFSQKDYLNLIESCGSISNIELMVHPYILDEEVLDLYEDEIDTKIIFLKKCEREYEMLSKEALFDDFNLINFRQLGI